MSYRNREIETKLILTGANLPTANKVLAALFDGEKTKIIFGSSSDTYWAIQGQEADFIRMRERDGIRQITVKSKDRGSNLNRLEVDIDSTSDVSKITRLLTAAHGKPLGKIGKTYYVYWLTQSEHTTVCCYVVTDVDPHYPHVIVEVETISMDKMLALETRVVDAFKKLGFGIERAPGSLFEMFLKEKA